MEVAVSEVVDLVEEASEVVVEVVGNLGITEISHPCILNRLP